MHFSTAYEAKNTSLPSSVTIFVALYLILLAFFIILTKDLSFDQHKKTVAMRSLQETFGRPKIQMIKFGRLNEVKIEDFPAEIEKIFGQSATVIVPIAGDDVTVIIDKDYLYYSDEVNFKPEQIEKMMDFRALLAEWHEVANPEFIISLSESSYELDSARLEYFRNNLAGARLSTGLTSDSDNKFVMRVYK
ncbi:MAG: hypothetical protein COV36_03455 [Alphaproteobacteria bacterium CG11_big_fil_rev_8_21_14_0_20_44_7]|nr:MAG: hypothetical protein COV36_03455 [Alphaproteobacteria bacterium CG11_big_fil_rev_8_21_14_0_20_44_7]